MPLTGYELEERNRSRDNSLFVACIVLGVSVAVIVGVVLTAVGYGESKQTYNDSEKQIVHRICDYNRKVGGSWKEICTKAQEATKLEYLCRVAESGETSCWIEKK